MLIDPIPPTLFEVSIPVRPAAQHPQYCEFQHGLLMLFLFASSTREAHERALAIASQMPYQMLRRKIRIRVAEHASRPELELAHSMACQFGLGIALNAVPMSDDPIPGFDE